MAVPRWKAYYVDFIVYDKSNLPSGRISGLAPSQFTVLWARDADTTPTDISGEVRPYLAEIGSSGRYRFLLGQNRMDGDRISLEIQVPGNLNAYVIPITFYTVPSDGQGVGLIKVQVEENMDKVGYKLAATEHTGIRTDVQTAMTAQGYTSTRAPKLDNLDVAVSSRATASDVWNYTTRTLTSFGTLVADIWGYTSRTLTDASNIASAVWNSSTRTLTSFGTLVADIWSHTARTLTDASNIASAVWGHTTRTLTSFGTLVADIWNHTSRTLTDASNIASAVWGYSARTLTSFGALAQDTAAAVWNFAIESYQSVARSAAWLLRVLAAGVVGKVSGAEANTPTFRDLADTKNRITMQVDDSGNRSSVTLDGD